MGYQRKWLQATDVMVDQTTGALLVSMSPAVQSNFDLLAFPLYHVEGVEDVIWDVQFALAPVNDPEFSALLLSGDTSTSFAGLYYRVDWRGIPGTITPLTAEGIATQLSAADGGFRVGQLLVPLEAAALATLAPGYKYIRRARQKARGHDQWSVWHDEIIVW